MLKSIVFPVDTYYLAGRADGRRQYRQIHDPAIWRQTGVDIDGERPGILPSQARKQKRFKQKWFPGETVSIGIGQGYNTFTLMKPHGQCHGDAGQRRRLQAAFGAIC